MQVEFVHSWLVLVLKGAEGRPHLILIVCLKEEMRSVFSKYSSQPWRAREREERLVSGEMRILMAAQLSFNVASLQTFKPSTR